MQEPPPASELLKQLEGMLSRIKKVLAQEALDWSWSPQAGEWSLTEVLCHLRDVELEVHQARIQSLIAADHAFIPGVSADEWAEEREYCFQDGPGALREFIESRTQTLAILKDLSPQMWERTGRHAFFGPTSLHELVNLATRHDDIHWNQINSLIEGISK